MAEYVVVAELLVGVDVWVGGSVELAGAEVTGAEVGGTTVVPPSHKTVAFWSATSVCA